jgi:hypothetical protein
MRQVRLDAGKSTRFQCLSAFNWPVRPSATLTRHDLSLPKARSYPQNHPESGECRLNPINRYLGRNGDFAMQETTSNEAGSRDRQAAFDRRYRLLELKERRADRDLKRQELEISKGRGFSFTAGQATVAAAIIALLSGWSAE